MISNAISSLILVSSSLFATPVYISDVKAAREAGHLRVEVSGDGGIDPESARTVIDDGRLIIYLGGTRVRADNRSWDLQDGAGEIRAHRHKTQTELVVPLTGNGCAGPVELSGTETGITALVGCDGPVLVAPRSVSGRSAKTTRKPELETAKLKQLVELPGAAPTPSIPVNERAVTVTASATAGPGAHLEKVAKPEKEENAVTAAIAPAKEQAAKRPAAEREPLPRVASASATAVSAKHTAAAETTSAPTQVHPIPASSGAGGFSSVALPALLLAALAAVAYLVSRRRRGPNLRHIQILETTSLGPKRSLICARIGDETVILSSSEAGISLLKGGTSPALEGQGAVAVAAPSAAAATPVASLPNLTPTRAAMAAAAPMSAPEPRVEDHFIEVEQPIEEALADIPDPRPAPAHTQARAAFRAIEGGLAGLFAKRDGQFGRDEDMPSPFEDVLEDSLEDQELRQKLAAGMSARVR